MAKKKNKKRYPQTLAQRQKTTISLCIIAKDEEKNIEKALAWAKDVTDEQIVVDTGSTDCTKELAEHMGAKVVDFPWINDFSAAKNFAIEQAKGSWIVFFDADEYFLEQDAKTFVSRLSLIDKSVEYKGFQAIGCTLINLDDKGAHNSQQLKVLAFRNKPSIRYVGKIHEKINVDEKKLLYMDDIMAYHTGYSQSIYEEKQKSERNVTMLRTELKSKPDDLNLKGYLADSLSSRGDDESQRETAELFSQVIEGGNQSHNGLRVKAYLYFIRTYSSKKETQQKAVETCEKALVDFPTTTDFVFYLGDLYYNMGEYDKAWEILKKSEHMINNPPKYDESIFITATPIRVFGSLLLTANARADYDSVFYYSTVILSFDNSKQDVLIGCIKTALNKGITEEDVIPILADLYDLTSKEQRMFIKQAAVVAGAKAIAHVMEGNW